MICNTGDPPDVFQVVPEPDMMKGTNSDLLRRTGTYRLTSRTKYQIEWRQLCVRGKYRTTDLPRYRVSQCSVPWGWEPVLSVPGFLGARY